MIITIDGPAGSGKSTAARELAKRLQFEVLNTGAMYRAVALAMQRAGVDLTSPELASFLETIQIELPSDRVLLNNEDVTEAIRSPAMSDASSRIAENPIIRAKLVQQQRAIAKGRNMVCDGRDQGTVVFPDAECKFFLTAKVEARAERRRQELLAKGQDVPIEQMIAELLVRDMRDSTRAVGPLKQAEDAIVVETCNLTIEDVVHLLEQEVRRCQIV